jgi:hypothetical protein
MLALAQGKTVKNSVAKAKDWANQKSKSLDLAFPNTLSPEFIKTLMSSREFVEKLLARAWMKANIEQNADHLGFRGDGDATM